MHRLDVITEFSKPTTSSEDHCPNAKRIRAVPVGNRDPVWPVAFYLL